MEVLGVRMERMIQTHTRRKTAATAVLVIDDEEIMRRIAAVFLGQEGMQVSTAEDGFAGLELAARQRFDCIVIDLVMPGMCLETMLPKISKLQPGVPIIVMSGLMDDTLGESLIKRGASGFIAKPLEPEELVAVCRAAVADRQLL